MSKRTVRVDASDAVQELLEVNARGVFRHHAAQRVHVVKHVHAFDEFPDQD